MKTGKKTGRWKYAVPVLILVLILALLGLLWNNVNNTSNSTDEIYLYGEWHSDSHILDRELEIWGEYYKKGMRDLFVEYPYTDAQFLNLWMQADDDELLDQQFKDWEGTAGGTEIVKNFLKQIKKTYPKTVFHGTDVGHTWHSTGPRYLKYLKSTGQMDTEEYQRALLNIQQGKRYARICQTNEEAAEQYREDRMVENFQRSYQELEETHRTDIMGIYGNAHIVNTGYLNAEYYMAKQLKESYGEKLHTTDLTQEPQRIDTLEVSGKPTQPSIMANRISPRSPTTSPGSSGGSRTHTRTSRIYRKCMSSCRLTITPSESRPGRCLPSNICCRTVRPNGGITARTAPCRTASSSQCG